jgi:(p)ppGpp synthase/HD superfamily hydrolase
MQLRYINRDMTINGGNGVNYVDNVRYKKADKAFIKAKALHDGVNHTYDGMGYFDAHIARVYKIALNYIHLIPKEYREAVLIAVLFHDAIEDARVTYNDIVKWYGKNVAEIVFALTNDKGRTRKERAGSKYYKGIRNTAFATFVKLCDRIGNMGYSKEVRSTMFNVYKKEHPAFIKALKGTDTLLGKIKYWWKEITNSFEADYTELYQALDDLYEYVLTKPDVRYNEK